MSSSTKNFQFRLCLYFFILAGLILRIMGLFYFPSGMEGDEVAVVYWGRKWIQEGHWLLIESVDLPAWETPSAYIFGGLDLIGINPRLGAVVISFFELGVCFLWTRRRAGAQVALIATAFLALMPWHFFFSYVLGPCSAGLWTSLYLLDIKHPWGRMAANMGGLFYYVSFRVILLWGGIVHLVRRHWRRLFLDVFSGLAALGILALLGQDHLRGFFIKGSYLVERGYLEAAHHYINAIFLWWVPPLQVYWDGLTQYNMDDVGFGLANTLGYSSPLSYGISFFFGWGLWIAFRENKYRDVVFLFILTVLLVGFTPSYVHFPFILPVVAFIAALGAGHGAVKWSWGKQGVIASLVIALGTVVFVIFNFGTADRWKTFTGHTDKIPAVLSQETGNEKFVWTTGYDFYRARLAAHRADLPLVQFEVNRALWLSSVTRTLYETQTHWVYLQNTTLTEHPRPEFKKMLKDFQEDFAIRQTYFEANVSIKSKKDVVVEGLNMGVLYEVDR